MIRKKWTGGKPVLSVETEDEFYKALPLGLPIEVSPEIAEGIGLMEEDVGTLEESNAARQDPCTPGPTLRDRVEGVFGEMATLRFVSASPPSPQRLDGFCTAAAARRKFSRERREKKFGCNSYCLSAP